MIDPLREAESMYRLGDLRRAEEACRRISKRDPRYFEALKLLGRIHAATGNFAKAAKAFNAALRINRSSTIFLDLGNSQAAQGDYRLAIKSFDKALALDSHSAAAFNNRGNALFALKKPLDAIAAYQASVKEDPAYANAYVNLGNCLRSLGRFEEAKQNYSRALELVPAHPKALFALSMIRLSEGKLPDAWHDFEWRRHKDNLTSAQRFFSSPPWLGNGDLTHKTILLHAEQGIGDTIQFCRYVSAVKQKAAKVILEVQTPLRKLMETLEGPDELTSPGDPPPRFHEHCPLMSLPLAFGTTLANIPDRCPYLFGTAESSERWAEHLGTKTRPRIGIAWRGNEKHTYNHLRSMTLADIRPLFKANAEFFALQFDIHPTEASTLKRHGNVAAPGRDLGDFSETASFISQLDLVISVDTATAHLAGALGKPVWILLPFSADWRWLQDRETSPWYPSARLFRQPAYDDWKSVVDCVSKELERGR